MMTLTRLFSLIALLSVAACGGGGGNKGDSTFGSGGSAGGGGTPTAPKLALIVNPATVTVASPGTVTATITTAAGAGIPGQVVQFSSQGGLGKFSTSSALTDGGGVATVTVTPASTTTTGADTVVANATVSGVSLTASAGFQLTATNVTIASFTSDIGAASLVPYGTATLTVVLSVGASGNPTNVVVSSSCVTRGLATLTPASTTTSTGIANFTFRDNGCGADLKDTLQASVTGTAARSDLVLNLAAPTVASIEFVSSTPETIYLRGSGFVENSSVTFRVVDAGGNGVRGQNVLLEPTTLAGGLKVDDLGTPANFPITKVTDSNGNVVVRVNSGTVPTPVRIRARMTIAGVEVSTVSSTLAIAVGLPSQMNFSLSQGSLNIEGYNVDGTVNTYTIIASDRLGNPVPDGTAINFVAEGGQVQAIRFTATTGGLSRAVANFQTSSPRPTDGRVTILAYALGEKSFIDGNGNNVFDDAPAPAELYQDLGDPFLDRLFNGVYASAPNQFIPQSPSGAAACAAPASLLLALDRSIPIRPGTCTGSWGRAYVRRSTETVFSTSSARPMWGLSSPGGSFAPAGQCGVPISLIVPNGAGNAYDAAGTGQTLSYYPFGGSGLYSQPGTGVLAFLVSDANPVAFNPMAAGTTVSASATIGLTAAVAGGSPVPSTSAPTGLAVSYSFAAGTTAGTITVSIRSPGGLTSIFSQFITTAAPPAAYTACP
jgi:hypothetical protein